MLNSFNLANDDFLAELIRENIPHCFHLVNWSERANYSARWSRRNICNETVFLDRLSGLMGLEASWKSFS
jgi:hypothetical protein